MFDSSQQETTTEILSFVPFRCLIKLKHLIDWGPSNDLSQGNPNLCSLNCKACEGLVPNYDISISWWPKIYQKTPVGKKRRLAGKERLLAGKKRRWKNVYFWKTTWNMMFHDTSPSIYHSASYRVHPFPNWLRDALPHIISEIQPFAPPKVLDRACQICWCPWGAWDGGNQVVQGHVHVDLGDWLETHLVWRCQNSNLQIPRNHKSGTSKWWWLLLLRVDPQII